MQQGLLEGLGDEGEEVAKRPLPVVAVNESDTGDAENPRYTSR